MNGSRGLLAWCHFQMTDSVLLLRNSQPTLLSKEKVGAHQGICKSFELLPSSEIHTSASYSVSEIAADGDSETRVCPCGAAPEAASCESGQDLLGVIRPTARPYEGRVRLDLVLVANWPWTLCWILCLVRLNSLVLWYP